MEIVGLIHVNPDVVGIYQGRLQKRCLHIGAVFLSLSAVADGSVKLPIGGVLHAKTNHYFDALHSIQHYYMNIYKIIIINNKNNASKQK